MKKYLILLLLTLSAPVNTLAGAELAGTTSLNFLKIPPSARAVAMGEAFTAVSNGTSGIYYNPAGLSLLSNYEIQATHINWFRNIFYEYASIAAPFEEIGVFGLGFSRLQVTGVLSSSDLPAYDSTFLNSGVDLDSYIDGEINPFSYSVILAYGRNLTESISAGVSLKLLSENIDTFSGLSFAADVGLMYKLNMENNLFKFGLAAANIGSNLQLGETAFELPKILKIGASDRIEIFENNLLVSAQAVLQADYDAIYGIGAEYRLYGLVALRAGYKFGAFNHPTFGMGVEYSNFEFNYAFENYDELGGTHRVSMLYSWGTPPVKLNVNPYVFSPNKDKYHDYAYFIPELQSKEKIKSISVDIYNRNGIKLTSITSQTAKPDKIPWNGKIGDRTASDGIYSAKIRVNYSGGESESSAVQVEVDNTPPAVRVDGEPKLLKPGKKDALLVPATFTFYAEDKNEIAGWRFVIWDRDKKVFFTKSGSGEPPVSFVWDGKGNNGRYVDTGEIYYYSLAARDGVGNKRVSKPQSQVILLKEIKLTYSSDALFDPGKADVEISAYDTLKNMKKVIEKYPESKILVTGHTDSLSPKGTKYKTNKELSKARAEAVKFFMVNLLNMDEGRIKTRGMGASKPVASNKTTEGRQKNRRVEITIKSTVYK